MCYLILDEDMCNAHVLATYKSDGKISDAFKHQGKGETYNPSKPILRRQENF